MSNLPASVQIHEEGPREGFQSEPRIFSVADKLRLIDALAATGLAQIQCASFVNPRQVPQMADAEELAAQLQRRPGVRYTGLWLNERGMDRALASGLDPLPIAIASASNTFALKNNRCDASELIRRQDAMLTRYRERGLELEAAYVFTAFGCCYEGKITPRQCIDTTGELLAACADQGVRPRAVYLCDTVGFANPAQIEHVLEGVRDRWPEQEFALHLHDTRGMGLANAAAALRLGVTQFDASCGGMGGCPFSGSATAPGNICTEDLAFMCEEMGIATGLDIAALCEAARLAESIVGHPLPGKMMRSGLH